MSRTQLGFTPNISNISNSFGKGIISQTTTDKGLQLRQIEVLGLQEDMLADLGLGVDRLQRQVRPPLSLSLSLTHTHIYILSLSLSLSLGFFNRG
jgi:hypothetical protein